MSAALLLACIIFTVLDVSLRVLFYVSKSKYRNLLFWASYACILGALGTSIGCMAVAQVRWQANVAGIISVLSYMYMILSILDEEG